VCSVQAWQGSVQCRWLGRPACTGCRRPSYCPNQQYRELIQNGSRRRREIGANRDRERSQVNHKMNAMPGPGATVRPPPGAGCPRIGLSNWQAFPERPPVHQTLCDKDARCQRRSSGAFVMKCLWVCLLLRCPIFFFASWRVPSCSATTTA